MRRMKFHLALIVAVVPACTSSNAAKGPDALPCAPAATELAAKLEVANGYNMDLTKPDVEKKIAAAKAEIQGKRIALQGCHFKSQGNDSVWFAANADAKDTIECVVAGGRDGHRRFRHAAMEFDIKKLRLDITGTVAEHGEGQFKKLALTECEITPHE
jgi:hypothetical protein